MTRMTIDCRTMPSESGCSLTISGEPDEVIRAAAAHAVDVHGHQDGPELQDGLRAALIDDCACETQSGAFVQLFEFRTDRIADFEDVEQQWVEAIGDDRTARWAITGADRNDTQRYIQIVAFPDHESAMANSKHPATSRFAESLRGLANDDIAFRDLDIRRARVF